MKWTQFDWKLVHGLMITFYVLGLVTYLIMGDLSELIHQLIVSVFTLIVVKEVIRYVRRLKREKNEKQ
ncbi:hypothetical protein SAMN05421734_10696 [Pelagirhabdus alkalitolerans]|uniref:Uncharacterized protein n=1 Tax=Pelagirhabdus alkalitolerans TaxID=1612202 RepID=A0A1G6KI53_9BACI|nr:hypothetical protein [Pelagirhabdus alkalitolerans]SDC30508.1 hypothetical protein SAMN05421734_10696 [Pelagirhabdus alkalitolerans]